MVGSDENDAGVVGALDLPRGSRAIGGKSTAEILECYKALSAIDGNIVPGESHPSDVHKRSAITEKNASVATKNPKISVHHPTNREYTSLIASEQQPISEETKDFNHSIIVDVDDYKAKGYTSLSMYLQQTDVKLEENDQMDDGIEMEYFEEYLIAKIDCPDKKDVHAVADYADDIHALYKRTESLSCVPPDYMNLQPDINEIMRAILINWLIQVHQNFGLIDETLYLTVNLIDRFLAVEPVLREKLQLVGVTAMLLASKYEEVYVPAIEDFLKITGMAYCRKDVLDMEQSMINTLQFNLSVPTPYAFMWRFLKAAQSDKKLECMSFFLLELCLVEYQMLRFPPSQLAAAAIFTAECTFTGWKHWTKTCEKYTNYTEDQLLECSKLMVTLHQNAGSGELTAVHQKYSPYKFGYAAKYAPAFFLLDA